MWVARARYTVVGFGVSTSVRWTDVSCARDVFPASVSQCSFFGSWWRCSQATSVTAAPQSRNTFRHTSKLQPAHHLSTFDVASSLLHFSIVLVRDTQEANHTTDQSSRHTQCKCPRHLLPEPVQHLSVPKIRRPNEFSKGCNPCGHYRDVVLIMAVAKN